MTKESSPRPLYIRSLRSVVSALSVCCLWCLLWAGCVGAPRPVPTQGQPIAQTEVEGLVLSVPRLDRGAYPGDVLDIAAAVYVVVENRGATEVTVEPTEFSLGSPGGMRFSPMDPRMLAVRGEPAGTSSGVASAIVPEGSLGVLFAGPAHAGGSSGGGGMRGGGSGGAFRGGSGYRVGGGYRGPAYRGGYRGYGYGGGLGWGFYGRPWAPYWDPFYSWYGWAPGYYGPRYYAYSREDAVQMGLPAGKLPPGARTAGFLYFPRLDVPGGSHLVLRWQPRNAATLAVVADIQLPLDVTTD